MILVDYQIREWAENGGIEPFHPDMINPASIDLRMGTSWRDIHRSEELHLIGPRYSDSACLTLYRPTWWNRLLRRPSAVLISTLELISIPPDMAAMVKLKTTPTRKGLGHPIADWVDPGFVGQLTMMLYVHKDFHLQVGDRIAQLVLFTLSRMPKKHYGEVGHYYRQRGATRAWDET